MENTPLSTFFDHLDEVMESLAQLNELVDNHFNYDPDTITWAESNDVARVAEALAAAVAVFKNE